MVSPAPPSFLALIEYVFQALEYIETSVVHPLDLKVTNNKYVLIVHCTNVRFSIAI